MRRIFFFIAEAFRAEMLDYWAGFERDGEVVEPRPFLIVEGRRR